MAQSQQVMTIAEFDTYTEQYPDQRFELIEGVIIEVPRPLPIHAYVVDELNTALLLHVKAHGLGRSFSDSIEYLLADDLVLAPDVSFVAQDRLPALTSRFTIAPDLAVEVASPSNNPRQLQQKALLYLQNGVRLVWLIFPEDQSVDVCTLHENQLTLQFLQATDTLTGGDVVAGFDMPIARLFSSN